MKDLVNISNAIITIYYEVSDKYRNEITDFLDNSLMPKLSHDKYFNNYIFDKYEDKWTLRYPGATRGHIHVDENEVVLDIKIYEDSDYIYDKEKLKGLNKFIGRKIIIKK